MATSIENQGLSRTIDTNGAAILSAVQQDVLAFEQAFHTLLKSLKILEQDEQRKSQIATALLEGNAMHQTHATTQPIEGRLIRPYKKTFAQVPALSVLNDDVQGNETILGEEHMIRPCKATPPATPVVKYASEKREDGIATSADGLIIRSSKNSSTSIPFGGSLSEAYGNFTTIVQASASQLAVRGSTSDDRKVRFQDDMSPAVRVDSFVRDRRQRRSTQVDACGLHSQSKKALKRLLRLDDSWLDLYLAHEDEVDGLLDRVLKKASNESLIKSHSRMSLPGIKFRTPLLHPHSSVKITWDFIGFMLLTSDMMTLPMMLAWDLDVDGVFLFLYVAALVFWPLDILISFNTCYYSYDIVVENRRQICLHYCRGWFSVDVLLVSIDFIMWALPEHKALRTLKNLRALRIFRLLRVMKLSKVGTTVAAAFSAKGTQMMSLALAILKVVVFNVLTTAHILACVWFYMGRLSKEEGQASWLNQANILDASLLRQYIFSVHWILGQVTPAPMNIHPQSLGEQVFTVFVILFSLFVFGGSLAKLRSTLDSVGKQLTEMASTKERLALYLRNCQAPVELTARILRFAELRLERSANSLAEPPAGLVSKTLMDELMLGVRKPVLSQHPLFHSIDKPFAGQGTIVVRLCSEALVAQLHEPEQKVFVEGTLAHWLLFAAAGRYELEVVGRSESRSFIGPCWFSEVCLFARHIHSSTLSASSIADAFTVSRADLMACIQASPVVIVSVAQYARKLLELVSIELNANGVVPDYLPPELSEEACQAMHLQLLYGSKSRQGERDWEKARMKMIRALGPRKVSTAQPFMDKVFQKAIVPEHIEGEIRAAFPELDDRGIFEVLGHRGECDCVVAAISSALFLLNDQHDAFVASQESGARLTLQQWTEFRNLVKVTTIDVKSAHAIFVFLLLRGLVKSKRFVQACEPKARKTRERMIAHCLPGEYSVSATPQDSTVSTGLTQITDPTDDSKDLSTLLPSILTLDRQQMSLVYALCDIYEKFNMPQFLQGENLPNALAALQEHLKVHLSSGEHELFKQYLFTQVCVLCGLSGGEQAVGSSFMTSDKAIPVLLGLYHIQDVEDSSVRDIFFSYLIARSNHVGLDVNNAEALALSRLICLSRIIDEEGLKPLLDAWHNLSVDEKLILTNHFTSDGIMDFAIVLNFLPRYLSNALQNQVVGTLRALRVLVEILNLLHARGFDGIYSLTVTVDLQSLADLTGAVNSSQGFEKCVDFIRLRQAGEKILLVIDDHKMPGDLRDQMSQIQRTVKQIAVGQGRMDVSLSRFLNMFEHKSF